MAGQFTQQYLCTSSTLLEIPQPGSIITQSAERVSQMLCNHGELYPLCNDVGTGGQQTFLCIGVFIDSSDKCSVITYSYTFPLLEWMFTTKRYLPITAGQHFPWECMPTSPQFFLCVPLHMIVIYQESVIMPLESV